MYCKVCSSIYDIVHVLLSVQQYMIEVHGFWSETMSSSIEICTVAEFTIAVSFIIPVSGPAFLFRNLCFDTGRVL